LSDEFGQPGLSFLAFPTGEVRVAKLGAQVFDFVDGVHDSDPLMVLM
jgi:hypothetical protein